MEIASFFQAFFFLSFVLTILIISQDLYQEEWFYIILTLLH